MTDRELLELAAKAVGLVPSEHDGVIYVGFGSREWNPITDDGDALRLAVKLDILNMNSILNKYIIEEQRRNLRDVATRRAIVRAAAEIGRERK